MRRNALSENSYCLTVDGGELPFGEYRLKFHRPPPRFIRTIRFTSHRYLWCLPVFALCTSRAYTASRVPGSQRFFRNTAILGVFFGTLGGVAILRLRVGVCSAKRHGLTVLSNAQPRRRPCAEILRLRDRIPINIRYPCGMCLFYGAPTALPALPNSRFVICLSGYDLTIVGFFSGRITSIIGDFKQVGIALLLIVFSAWLYSVIETDGFLKMWRKRSRKPYRRSRKRSTISRRLRR